MKTHELAPGRFSWRKYPEQINLELVRVRLSEAKSPEHGSTLRGSGTRGWKLTVAGLEAALRLSKDSNPSIATPAVRERGGSVDAQRSDRAKARIKASEAWRKWPGDKDKITASEAEEVFRIDGYSSDEQRADKIDRLRKTLIGDSQLLDFLAHLESLLRKPKTSG